jgi:hypothetical protein
VSLSKKAAKKMIATKNLKLRRQNLSNSLRVEKFNDSLNAAGVFDSLKTIHYTDFSEPISVEEFTRQMQLLTWQTLQELELFTEKQSIAEVEAELNQIFETKHAPLH